MAVRLLVDLLRQAAVSAAEQELIFYSPHGKASMSYADLFCQVEKNAKILQHNYGITAGHRVLLHLDSHLSYVIWFWSVVAAGAIPIVSTPLPADPQARERHLKHLGLLLIPHLITTKAAKNGELAAWNSCECVAFVDDMSARCQPESSNDFCFCDHRLKDHNAVDPDGVAFMMLTSGSTGAAKAVEIRHSQVLFALNGKSKMLQTGPNDKFLNWIGFDHVACVTEIHFHAMFLGVTQVHIEPQMSIQDPLIWLKHMATHKISITFAPSFFLAATIRAIDDYQPAELNIDLSRLRVVVSGGEANKVSTGIAFNNAVKKLGAKGNVVCPAFGMTETCAGSVYNMEFPEFDEWYEREFCSVGEAIEGMELYIAREQELKEGEISKGDISEKGPLQLRGPNVFRSYYNNPERTEASFTTDGWFLTGDIGYLSTELDLNLVGRSKDSIIINGVKYFSHELETIVEETAAVYLVPSYTAVFSVWSDKADTEEIVVTFLASQQLSSDEDLLTAFQKVENSVFLHCSVKPRTIIPLPLENFRKSSLGKLSRQQMKANFRQGAFDDQDRAVQKRISGCRQRRRQAPETDMEITLTKLFAEEFGLDAREVSIGDGLVDMGVDSIRLLRFKSTLQRELGMSKEIPVGLLLTNPTIGSLAKALSEGDEDNGTKAYGPVVVLQSGKADEATPIWFIHPGLGEVLVFLNISRYFSERPVYALRAPGFNPGEEMFASIDEMTNVYMKAIKQRQPRGPYILIGYSFGSMIAFETSKKLEAAAGGATVFTGSLNGPPHIKWRMRQIDWCELFLNLAYFLGLLTETEAVRRSDEFRRAGLDKEKAQIVERVLALAAAQNEDDAGEKKKNAELLARLDLDAEKLTHWADVSSRLQGLARDYDPAGAVQHLDVFYAKPLLAVSDDKQVWLEEHLHKWNDYCLEPVRFHDSPGAHYTMLDPDHVFEMQRVLRAALRARGVL